MPVNNNFQHAKYSRADLGERALYRTFLPGAEWGSPAWQQGMKQAGAQLVDAGVRGCLFLQGTPFMDLFGAGRLDEAGGLKRGYSRGIPGLESLLALLRPDTNGIVGRDELLVPPLRNEAKTKKLLDEAAGDLGNFSLEYVRRFQEGICGETPGRVACESFVWSSVNHHLGRVEAALDLVEFLLSWAQELSIEAPQRLLIQGHGHAGQVLALLSNMVAPGESSTLQWLFQILAGHYERIGDHEASLDRLDRLFRVLTTPPFLNGTIFDVVTYGTPVRYGWDPSGIGHLLHVINHRPVRSDGKRWLAKMELPHVAWEMPMVAGGDYVQQLAVAGSDVASGSPQDLQVIQELQEVLEPYDGFERWLECARRGTRCPQDGQCLLVDYQVTGDASPREHLFGHGCYTRIQAMLFHVLEMAQSLRDFRSQISNFR